MASSEDLSTGCYDGYKTQLKRVLYISKLSCFFRITILSATYILNFLYCDSPSLLQQLFRNLLSTQSAKAVFPPAVISRIKIKRQRMHSSVLPLLQLLAFSAMASPLGHLLTFTNGDDTFDTTSYAESPGLLYKIAGGLVPDRQSAQPELPTPVNQLKQPFACTERELPVPACCPQNVYITADPNCIPYLQFSGSGCERNDGIQFRGACCNAFSQLGGIMCQDPSVLTNIPQVFYENINQNWIPSQQQVPNPSPNQQLPSTPAPNQQLPPPPYSGEPIYNP